MPAFILGSHDGKSAPPENQGFISIKVTRFPSHLHLNIGCTGDLRPYRNILRKIHNVQILPGDSFIADAHTNHKPLTRHDGDHLTAEIAKYILGKFRIFGEVLNQGIGNLVRKQSQMFFGLRGKDVHTSSSKARLDDEAVFEVPAIHVGGQRSHGTRNVVRQTELTDFVFAVTDPSGRFTGYRHSNLNAFQTVARPPENRQLVVDCGNDQATSSTSQILSMIGM
jgi:hypothetical protein